MPAKSQAQRALLNAKFGHAWVKKHHFDNKGALPEHVGDKKVAKKHKAYHDHGSHKGHGHSHIGAHHGGHGTGHGGYTMDKVGAKTERDPLASEEHHAMNKDAGCGFCQDSDGDNDGD